MAHFWWTISNPSTPNDWINEGLAEFSAFRLTEDRFGRPFADARLAEYRQNASRSKTTASIAETASDSPDREINRYDKATLMLLEAQRRFGSEPLDRLLKELHTRYAGTLQATTADFLAEAGKQMGPGAETYFRTELYRNAVPAGADDGAGKKQ
jgi:predicted RecB family nuclease